VWETLKDVNKRFKLCDQVPWVVIRCLFITVYLLFCLFYFAFQSSYINNYYADTLELITILHSGLRSGNFQHLERLLWSNFTLRLIVQFRYTCSY